MTKVLFPPHMAASCYAQSAPYPRLVALAGRAGAGKSTLAKALTTLSDRGDIRRMSFMDVARDMLRALGVEERYLTDRAFKEVTIPQFGASARHMLRTLGTEWGREQVHNDLWVRAAKLRILEFWCTSGPFSLAVMDDCRFANEVEMVKSLRGRIIYVYNAEAEAVPVRHRSESLGVIRACADAEITITKGQENRDAAKLWETICGFKP